MNTIQYTIDQMDQEYSGPIQVHDASWLFDRVKGLEVLMSFQLFQTIFSSGGFIAGGFLRYLLKTGSTSDIEHYMTVHKSDIDVFFRNEADVEVIRRYVFREYLKLIETDKSFFHDWREQEHVIDWKRTKNAMSCDISLLNTPIKLQLVTCNFDQPINILLDFDFANCKIAFDGKYVYIDERLEELEKQNCLKIDKMMPSIIWRLSKYVKKYDYKLHPASSHELYHYIKNFSQYRGPAGESITNNDTIKKLILLGENVFDDEIIASLRGAADMLICDDYDHPKPIKVDVAQSELNRRALKLKSGDLVKTKFTKTRLKICILLGKHEDVPRTWHVFYADNTVGTLSEYMIESVISDINEAI